MKYAFILIGYFVFDRCKDLTRKIGKFGRKWIFPEYFNLRSFYHSGTDETK